MYIKRDTMNQKGEKSRRGWIVDAVKHAIAQRSFISLDSYHWIHITGRSQKSLNKKGNNISVCFHLIISTIMREWFDES